MERSSTPWLVVSVHDVAPASFGECRGWVDELERLGITATLLVIPGPWRGESLQPGTAFTSWLGRCSERGHEIAQHGWSHQSVDSVGGRSRRMTGRVLARGCEEFWSLDEGSAAGRLVRGRVALDLAGFPVQGFTPPGWLASPAATTAMRTVGFRYTTTHRAVIDLQTGSRHAATAFCHRPGGALETTGSVLMRSAARRLPSRGRNIRLALHPGEYEQADLRRASIEAIELALAAGARPRTYLQVVAPPPLRAARVA